MFEKPGTPLHTYLSEIWGLQGHTSWILWLRLIKKEIYVYIYIYTMTLGKCKTNFNKMYISTLFSLLPDLFCFFGNSEALNTSRPQAKLCFNVEGWVLRLSVHLTLMHFCKQSSFFSSFSLLLSARGSISWHTHCEQRAVNPRGASANESWQKQ